MTDQLPSKDKLLIELRGWHTLKGADCFRQAADEIETLRRKLDTCGLECSATLKSLVAENEKLQASLDVALPSWRDGYERDVELSALEMERREIARLRTTLRGISTCSTCEACRGAATRALGGAVMTCAPKDLTYVERCKQARFAAVGERWRKRRVREHFCEIIGNDGRGNLQLAHWNGRVTKKWYSYLASDYERVQP